MEASLPTPISSPFQVPGCAVFIAGTRVMTGAVVRATWTLDGVSAESAAQLPWNNGSEDPNQVIGLAEVLSNSLSVIYSYQMVAIAATEASGLANGQMLAAAVLDPQGRQISFLAQADCGCSGATRSWVVDPMHRSMVNWAAYGGVVPS